MNPELLHQILVPASIMFLVGIVSTLVLWSKRKKTSHKLDVDTPFAIKPAVKFSAFFLAVLLLQHFSHMHLGYHGLYAVSLISGLADVERLPCPLRRWHSAGR